MQESESKQTRYAIVCIGCLCYDTPSFIEAVVSSMEEAYDMAWRATSGRLDINQVYQVFEIPAEDFKSQTILKDIEYHEEKMAKRKAKICTHAY